MFVLISFCLISSSTEQLFNEDQNTFLTAFLDSDAEQIDCISIRMQVIELLEDCFFQNKAFDLCNLQEVLTQFFFNQIPDKYLATNQKIVQIQAAKSVEYLDFNSICLP